MSAKIHKLKSSLQTIVSKHHKVDTSIAMFIVRHLLVGKCCSDSGAEAEVAAVDLHGGLTRTRPVCGSVAPSADTMARFPAGVRISACMFGSECSVDSTGRLMSKPMDWPGKMRST